MAASCEAEDTVRLKNAFRKSFDKLRAGLQLEIKPLNSNLYSKGLISGEVRMKDDIYTTLSAISIRLENTDVTKSTFFGFTEAVSQIDSKMHLKTMLEYHANESTDRDITAAGVHISGTASSEQAWRQKDLETSRDSAMSAITGSVENLRSVSWRQVIDEENCHSHSDHHSESGNMPNVSVEYVRELEEHVLELENNIKQLRKEKHFSRELMLDKTSDVSKANSQLEEAFNLLQSKEDEADDLRQTLHLLKKRITTLEATTIKAMEAHNLKQAVYEEVREKADKDKTRLKEERIQAEEKARQAEKKASQAERAFQAEKQLNALQLNEYDQDFEEHRQAEEEWEEEAHQQDEEEWEEEARQRDEWEEEARQRDEWEEEARQRDEWEEEAHQRDEWEEEARQRDGEEWEEEAHQRDEWEEEARQRDGEEWEEEARQRDEWEEEARQRDEWEEEARQRDEWEEEAHQQDEEEETRQRDEYEEEARQRDEYEEEARQRDEEEW